MTRATLFPRSIVVMKRSGRLYMSPRILAESPPLFLSSSRRSLSEERKAISIPEKRAEATRVSRIYRYSIAKSDYLDGAFFGRLSGFGVGTVVGVGVGLGVVVVASSSYSMTPLLLRI